MSKNLAKSIFSSDSALSEKQLKAIVLQWVEIYQKYPSEATLNLVDLILISAGSPKTFSPEELENLSSEAAVEKLSSFQSTSDNSIFWVAPLSNPKHPHRKDNFVKFWSTFVRVVPENILFASQIIDQVLSWARITSQLLIVSARYVSSLLSIGIVDELVDLSVVVANGIHSLEKNLSKLQAQYDLTLSTSRTKRNREGEDAQIKTQLENQLSNTKSGIKDLKASQKRINENISSFFNRIFVFRFCDTDPLIRATSIARLSKWISLRPSVWFEDNHIRYFGWMLNDPDSNVRNTILSCIQSLFHLPECDYDDPQSYQLFWNKRDKYDRFTGFLEKFGPRMIQVALFDSKKSTQLKGFQTLLIWQECWANLDSLSRQDVSRFPNVEKIATAEQLAQLYQIAFVTKSMLKGHWSDAMFLSLTQTANNFMLKSRFSSILNTLEKLIASENYPEFDNGDPQNPFTLDLETPLSSHEDDHRLVFFHFYLDIIQWIMKTFQLNCIQVTSFSLLGKALSIQTSMLTALNGFIAGLEEKLVLPSMVFQFALWSLSSCDEILEYIFAASTLSSDSPDHSDWSSDTELFLKDSLKKSIFQFVFASMGCGWDPNHSKPESFVDRFLFYKVACVNGHNPFQLENPLPLSEVPDQYSYFDSSQSYFWFVKLFEKYFSDYVTKLNENSLSNSPSYSQSNLQNASSCNFNQLFKSVVNFQYHFYLPLFLSICKSISWINSARRPNQVIDILVPEKNTLLANCIEKMIKSLSQLVGKTRYDSLLYSCLFNFTQSKHPPLISLSQKTQNSLWKAALQDSESLYRYLCQFPPFEENWDISILVEELDEILDQFVDSENEGNDIHETTKKIQTLFRILFAVSLWDCTHFLPNARMAKPIFGKHKLGLFTIIDKYLTHFETCSSKLQTVNFPIWKFVIKIFLQTIQLYSVSHLESISDKNFLSPSIIEPLKYSMSDNDLSHFSVYYISIFQHFRIPPGKVIPLCFQTDSKKNLQMKVPPPSLFTQPQMIKSLLAQISTQCAAGRFPVDFISDLFLENGLTARASERHFCIKFLNKMAANQNSSSRQASFIHTMLYSLFTHWFNKFKVLNYSDGLIPVYYLIQLSLLVQQSLKVLSPLGNGTQTPQQNFSITQLIQLLLSFIRQQSENLSNQKLICCFSASILQLLSICSLDQIQSIKYIWETDSTFTSTLPPPQTEPSVFYYPINAVQLVQNTFAFSTDPTFEQFLSKNVLDSIDYLAKNEKINLSRLILNRKVESSDSDQDDDDDDDSDDD